MKKVTISVFLLINTLNINMANAQQWVGPAASSGLIQRNGEISVYPDYIQRTSLGAAWGGGGMDGTGYLGFNLYRDNVYTGYWPYKTNGAANGGGVIFGRTNGDIIFSAKPNTGNRAGSLSDVDIVKNIRFSIQSSGKVEISSGDFTVRPNNPQRVSVGAAWGGGGLSGFGYIGFNLLRDNVTTGYWPYISDGSNNGAAVIYTKSNGDLLFSVKPTTGASAGSLSDVAIVNNTKMLLSSEGKVVIGNAVGAGSINYNSPDYRLFVEKGILTEKIRVAVKGSAEWADYVFAKDYKLMPLKQLAAYIKEEHHLPGVPATEEVIKEGVDIGQMQARLLQKIEELTLYVVQQQKEIDALKKKK